LQGQGRKSVLLYIKLHFGFKQAGPPFEISEWRTYLILNEKKDGDIVIDPYVDGLLKNSIYAEKSVVKGRLVAILNGELDNRGLQLISIPSRALRTGEIHELILTDDKNSAPGTEVNRINYVAFFEVTEPGIVIAGDQVLFNGSRAGFLAGYDETHMPNHMNIVFLSEKRATGFTMNLTLGDEIRFG
jgi:hypothetical protein